MPLAPKVEPYAYHGRSISYSAEGADTKASDKSLREILYSGDQYVVPAFQRYYRWKEENWEKLWDDVEELYDDDPGKSHFMGSLVCMPADHSPGVVPAYQLIDGQQRLVTLSLLLSALRDRAAKEKQTGLVEEIYEQFLVHKHKAGRERYKVFVRLRDREAYSAIVEEQKLSAAALDSKVYSAYDYFKTRIAGKREDGSKYDVRELLTMITDRLGFVLITLEGDSPFKIFKSLNSTGVPLEESDLIRNYVFMQVDLAAMDEFDDTHWRPIEKVFADGETVNSELLSGFFRDFLMSQGEYIRKYESAEGFERAYPPGKFKPVKLAESLTELAAVYSVILGRTAHGRSGVEGALRGLRDLDVGTPNPLVLKLLEANRSGQVSDDDVVAAINSIRGFVLRRYVCGNSSRAYGRWFATTCNEFSSGGTTQISNYLADKGWPDDAEFSKALLGFDLYDGEYGYAVLTAIERSIPSKERVDLSNAQVEHVMPQTLTKEWKEMLDPDHEKTHKTWKDTIGNLTLTGYNQELGNKPFAEKKKIYAESGIQMNKYFADKDRWTETEIVERGKEMAKIAARIFTGPFPE